MAGTIALAAEVTEASMVKESVAGHKGSQYIRQEMTREQELDYRYEEVKKLLKECNGCLSQLDEEKRRTAETHVSRLQFLISRVKSPKATEIGTKMRGWIANLKNRAN